MSDINEPEGQPENQAPGWRPPPQGGWAPPPPPPNWANTGQEPPWSNAPQEPGPWGGSAGDPGRGPYQWGGAPGDPGRGPYQWGPPGGWGPPQGPRGPGGWTYGWSSPSRPRRTLPGTVTAILLIVAVLVGLGIGHGVWRSIRNASGSTNGNGGITNPFGNNGNGGNNGGQFGNGNGGFIGGGNGNGSLNGVAANVASEMVDIDTDLSYESAEAAGTGIVLTSNGYVLTNNHVIAGATSLKATDIGNGNTYTATVVGYDRTHDVAVIKLSGASGLKTASFGDSDKASVGQQVVGLGNAGGVGGTPSEAAGQILALGQSITAQDEANGTSERLTNLIETNANIQSGDSGGALIDSSGQVIGMITAASTGFSFQTGGNQGFAIPINQAMTIGDTIRSGQTTSTVHIGATAFLGVEIDTSGSAANASGAVISSTISGGPAAQAGLGPGDVITSVGGKTVDSPAALTNLIQGYHPGDNVTVDWNTPGGQSQHTSVTLSSGPPQ